MDGTLRQRLFNSRCRPDVTARPAAVCEGRTVECCPDFLLVASFWFSLPCVFRDVTACPVTTHTQSDSHTASTQHGVTFRISVTLHLQQPSQLLRAHSGTAVQFMHFTPITLLSCNWRKCSSWRRTNKVCVDAAWGGLLKFDDSLKALFCDWLLSTEDWFSRNVDKYYRFTLYNIPEELRSNVGLETSFIASLCYLLSSYTQRISVLWCRWMSSWSLAPWVPVRSLLKFKQRFPEVLQSPSTSHCNYLLSECSR